MAVQGRPPRASIVSKSPVTKFRENPPDNKANPLIQGVRRSSIGRNSQLLKIEMDSQVSEFATGRWTIKMRNEGTTDKTDRVFDTISNRKISHIPHTYASLVQFNIVALHTKTYLKFFPDSLLNPSWVGILDQPVKTITPFTLEDKYLQSDENNLPTPLTLVDKYFQDDEELRSSPPVPSWMGISQ
ncbi:hypothetical protein J6590_058888 [Homalodisca vitripennis]|nr:hypothetical protein J6590_058888 [Homalodisca vitripennis]